MPQTSQASRLHEGRQRRRQHERICVAGAKVTLDKTAYFTIATNWTHAEKLPFRYGRAAIFLRNKSHFNGGSFGANTISRDDHGTLAISLERGRS
jgi:hypothetical protein